MFYLSRGLYGVRTWSHVDLYAQAPRWYFLEVGSWTLEVTVSRPSLIAQLPRFVTACALMALIVFHPQLRGLT